MRWAVRPCRRCCGRRERSRRKMMMTTRFAPFRLKPWFSERPWGKKSLLPWYEETGTTALVGEAWLTGPQCVVEDGELEGRTLESLSTELGGDFPLLVKL